MITRYKSGAGVTHNYTPSVAVAVGVAVLRGSVVGVTVSAIAANELGSLAMDGSWHVPKTANEAAFAQGAHVYLDVTNQLAKDTAGEGNIYPCVGFAAEAATAAATEVLVEFEPLPA